MENIVKLVDTDGVIALAGVVGSDVVDLAKNFILQRQIPYVGAVSGVVDLRAPFHREFVNVRISYWDEMVAQSLYLASYGLVQRVACLYQNDTFGIAGYTALAGALANVGIQLVATGTYAVGATDMSAAVEAIAGASQKAQAVVMVALQTAIAPFIPLFASDPRTDPDCIFTVVSSGWGTTISTAIDQKYWSRLYFFFAVPLPGGTTYTIAQKFAKDFAAAGKVPGPLAFEGYVIGRLITQVLYATHQPNPTSSMFLDTVYSTRLVVLDDLVLGLYSTNWTGCSVVLCSCNAGLREVHLAQLDPAIGGLGDSLGSLRFPITDCGYPMSIVKAPLLFGQLVPSWDNGWQGVALQIGLGIAQAFAEANNNGGAQGRNFMLLQQNYSTNATYAINAFADRYPLVGVIGSVTLDTSEISVTKPTIGDFDINPDPQDDTFKKNEIAFQPTTALELMGMVQFAVTEGCPIHLRVPDMEEGSAMLDVMIKSVNSFQKVPTSASLYTTGSDVLSSIQSGCVIALGYGPDVLNWYELLPSYPNLHLLTLGASAMRLMVVLPNASSLTQASRFHFPTIITGQWNTTISDPTVSEGFKYGFVLGNAAVQAILHSEYADDSYTTSAQLVTAWYAVVAMTSGSLSFGPFYGNNCTAGKTECECNQGTRSVGIRNAASTDIESLFSTTTCHVEHAPLYESSSSTAAIAGSVVGGVVFVIIMVVSLLLTKRNNLAAPKNSSKPFCVLFTDIQSSTHLWATIPDIMAPALDIHHALIRKLISKHKCYEVKTIGDSFMCAAHTPQQAVEMSLAIQQTFYTNDWGSEAINAVYREGVAEDDDGRISRSCWNGLRVRVGIHFGQGEVKRDPVSKGYDYYGTVVNTAARIESACHGGQIGVSQEVFDALGGSLPGSVWTDLGPHELRGLSEPIRLYQILPDGPYAMRTFPPLRVEKEDQVHEALQAAEEVAVVTQDGGSTKDGGLGRDPSGISAAGDWKWVETHPLVVHGDISAEELKKNFIIALTTLSTLLSTQTNKFKEVMLKGLCDRLHVPNCGVQGAQLQRTLKGLVHRVLPATVMNTQQSIPGSSERLSVYVTGMDAGSPASSNRVVRVRGGSAADSP
eukprot:GGOE01048099.1.p1 GENE.GGOE01048099.1~~GGOE01048099.1.p1  ORF type:complete len:1191 (-),score=342.59 GGOE01048099.1:131-3439(-)